MDDLDFRLAERARAGDAKALSALWCRHRAWLVGVVLSCHPPGADVEDIMQEIGMALVRDMETLRDPAAVRPWLRQVARRIAVNAIRRGVRDRSARQEARRPSSAAHERIDALLALVGGLPEHYREPLLLRAKGMTLAQIAELLELHVRTVETRLRRARALLRDQAESRETGEQALSGWHHDDLTN